MSTDTREALAAIVAMYEDGVLTLVPDQAASYDTEFVLAMENARAALATQPAQPSAQGEAVACVTDEMVAAYLTANDAYWKRIDGEPMKLGKWRNGTPSEATRVSLMAALAAAPAAQPSAQGEAVAELLKGWKLNHVQFVRGSGAAQIGWLDPEDDSFSPIVTVDTGLYYQPDAAVPLAQAIFDALASAPAAPAQAVPETEPVRGKRYEAGDWSMRNWEAMCEDQRGIKAAP